MAHMGRLYLVAEATLIWPGRLDLSTDYIPGNREQEMSKPLFAPGEIKSILDNEDSGASIPGQEYLEPRKNIRGLQRLLVTLTGATLMTLGLQQYWKRWWVMQEIVLAMRVQIIIGDMAHDFGDLVTALLYATDKDYSVVPRLHGVEHFDEALYGMKSRIWKYHIQRKLKPQREQTMAPTEKEGICNCEVVLSLNEGTECTTPHDRVYGLMGLLPKSLHIDPNYELPRRLLLKAILEKDIAYLAGRSSFSGRYAFPSIASNIAKILSCWSEYMYVDAEMPKDFVRFSSGALAKYGDPAVGKDIERNVRLVLEDLGILIPANFSDRYEKETTFVEECTLTYAERWGLDAGLDAGEDADEDVIPSSTAATPTIITAPPPINRPRVNTVEPVRLVTKVEAEQLSMSEAPIQQI